MYPKMKCLKQRRMTVINCFVSTHKIMKFIKQMFTVSTFTIEARLQCEYIKEKSTIIIIIITFGNFDVLEQQGVCDRRHHEGKSTLAKP